MSHSFIVSAAANYDFLHFLAQEVPQINLY